VTYESALAATLPTAQIARNWIFCRLADALADGARSKPQGERRMEVAMVSIVSMAGALAKAALPVRRRARRTIGALSLAAAWAAIAGCAQASYAGIPLAAGAADPELQQLARQAASGDRSSQLELGIRYEEGRGLPADPRRAEQLYRNAAGGEDNGRLAYVPGVGGRPGSWTLLNGGGGGDGLPEASLRLLALAPGSHDRRAGATLVDAGPSEPQVCAQLEHALAVLYRSVPSECAAYPFHARLANGRTLKLYDLVVSVPPAAAAQQDYATNLVDPVELELIDRSDPVSGTVNFYVVPTPEGPVPVIRSFEPER
jgi:hypothetical protein